jgi:hypothetical protein
MNCLAFLTAARQGARSSEYPAAGERLGVNDLTIACRRRFVEYRIQPTKGRESLQTSVEFVRTYHAQVHEMTDPIAATVTNAQAD